MTRSLPILFLFLAFHASALAQPARFDTLAGMSAKEAPARETAQMLRDELLFQRATQVYLWAMPLINTLGMKNGSEKAFGAGYNVLPVWKKRLDARTLITTPNSDLIYALSYLDPGRDGPLVFEAPPGLQGVLLDIWQRPIPCDGGVFFGDIGRVGPDAGRGGKFLLLPPGYAGAVPEGYYVYRPQTNNVFVFLRLFYEDPGNLAPAAALVEKTRIYPLGAGEKAKPMVFPDASGVPVNMLPRSDGAVFDDLKKLVDTEVANIADPDWLGMLAAIGIVKGVPFDPDARTRAILDRAARTGYRMSRVIGFDRIVTGRSLRVYPDRRWVNPMADASPGKPYGAFTGLGGIRDGGYLDHDMRIWYFTNYFSVSPGMVSQVPGTGARYMISLTDADGAPLSGSAGYSLTLPRDIPAAHFWSVTLYDAGSGSGLANGQPFPSLGSRDRPLRNADGSTDLYLAPKPPDGKKSNWLATVPGKNYFVVLRLYGPTEAAINKTWKPGDIKLIK